MSHVVLSRGGNFSHRKRQVHRSRGRNELPGGASLRLEEQEPTEVGVTQDGSGRVLGPDPVGRMWTFILTI